MGKTFKKIAWLVFGLVILCVLYVVGMIVYAQITYWQPQEVIEVERNDNAPILSDTNFTLISWNIGYCGLGEESDFFYDGGKMVRQTEPMVQKNLEGVENTLIHNNAHFVLLQEVDINSRRSYHKKENEQIQDAVKKSNTSFGQNYNVKFVPIPFTNPMGKVESGLLTLSNFEPKSSERIQFPGSFSFPNKLFFLKRCFLVNKYALANGKELVIINTHNSAYDKGGMLKKQEMAYLKNYLVNEYEKGNYVLVGGDWNQCPPDFKWDSFAKTPETDYEQMNIAPDFMPNGWHWIYDPSTATNRKLKEAFDANATFTTIIDFYLISPNITANQVKTVDTKFKFSDHQAVTINISLNP